MTDKAGPEMPAEPPSKTKPLSGHALGAQNRGTLLALGICCVLLLLLVIVGAILRAAN